VRNTFDTFAGSFDQVLDQLGYRAPSLIAECLTRLLPEPDASLIVADAGCGTGLCGEFLRPRAKQLVGVDLSPGMLARARVQKQYDELLEAELTAWLTQQDRKYDLIISADTLCYFGALEEPLSAAAGALRSGGRLVFTVENAGSTVPDYRLDSTGRYSHAESYVRASLAAAAFDAIEISQVVLRRERGHEVNGLLASAQRPL
jgi:predicted TPR repeat methyltransferase